MYASTSSGKHDSLIVHWYWHEPWFICAIAYCQNKSNVQHCNLVAESGVFFRFKVMIYNI